MIQLFLILIFTFLCAGTLPALSAQCGENFTSRATVYEEMITFIRKRLGDKAQITFEIKRRDEAQDDFGGLLWASLIVQVDGVQLGSIKLNANTFQPEFNSLRDDEFVRAFLNVSAERQHFVEMLKLLVDSQPSLAKPESAQVEMQRRLNEICGPLDFQQERDNALSRLHLELKWQEQRVAYGTFYFHNEKLELSRVSVQGRDPRPGEIDFRKMRIGSALVEKALQEFPHAKLVSVPELVDDNMGALTQALSAGEPFSQAFLKIPSYRAFARQGFSKIESIIVLRGGLPKKENATYGFVIRKDCP